MIKNNLIFHSWQKNTVIVLRALIIIAGVYSVFFGNLIIGIYILAALVAIALPAIITRNFIKFIPLEFELLFFIMVLLQLVIGETLQFHHFVPYYDKLVHFSIPAFVGLMGFLLAYTMQKTGNLKITVIPLIFLIVLITLGFGAIWEIIEYLYDAFIVPNIDGLQKAQGNLTESSLIDTMTDLIADVIGGIFGAIIGLRYIKSEQKKENSRLSKLINEIASNFRKKEGSLL